MVNKIKYHERVGWKIQKIREKCGVSVPDQDVRVGHLPIAQVEEGRPRLGLDAVFVELDPDG